VSELIHSLAVDLGPKPCLDIENRPSAIDEIHLMLGCLVEFTSEKGPFSQEYKVVRIAHLSVQEYLESDEILQEEDTVSRFALKHSYAHMEIAQTCLLYILEPKISQREAIRDFPMFFPFASYAAKEWAYHYKSSDTPRSDVKKLVVELFMDSHSAFKTWIQLRDLGRFKKTTAATPLYFACLLGFAEIAAELVRVYDVNAIGGRYGNALQAAVSQGHIDFVRTLLERSPDVDFGQVISSAAQTLLRERQETEIQVLANSRKPINVNARGGEYGTSLIAASYNGNRELVSMLLRKGSYVNDQHDQYGNALAAASLKGHETVVQDLLKGNADLNAPGGQYGHALVAASSAGHSKVVQTLLLQDRSGRINSRSGIWRDSFYEASLHGHSNVLKVLLNSRADVDADDGKDVTVLAAACLGGHIAAVQILIGHGANVNASSGRLGSALQAASLGGHIELVELLLNKGANINASGGRFGNALQAASFGTRSFTTQAVQQAMQQTIRLKFSEGIPDLPHFSNAPQVASLNQPLMYEKILELTGQIVASKLLGVHPTGNSGIQIPLLDASHEDRATLVQLLLDKGANINAPGGEFGSALQAASFRGLETVVKVLLDAKADVQASGGLHGSALQLATNEKHQGVMRMLQEALPKNPPS
jgi:ankyrin repeat protein